MSLDPLYEGATAAAHLTDHIARLKSRADRLLQAIRASDKGFFSPTEDEQVRQVLISYWHARNALMEIVLKAQQHVEEDGEHRQESFLIAYGSALVLIDAARYLRYQLGSRAVVREKLNEPEPAFGIPAGAYDTIQKSLTSPIHVWHLYHAARYWDEHKRELADVAAAHVQLQPLLRTIGLLQSQVQVSLACYVRARLQVRTQQFVSVVTRDLLGRALYGLQKAVSQLLSERYVVRDHRPALPTAVIESLSRTLQVGDVLITRKEHALTNYFLPGFWPHAALYLGDCRQLDQLGIAQHANVVPRWRQMLECDPAQPGRVLEALKDGVRVRSLACPLTCDAVAVLRPRMSPSLVAEAISRGFFHEGKPYDFDFDFTRSDRLVCSEVVYRTYEAVGGVTFSLTRRAGRWTLSPEDILQMALKQEGFRCAATFSKDHAQHLATDAEAEQVLQETLK